MTERKHLSRRDLLRLSALSTVATLASCVGIPATPAPSPIETAEPPSTLEPVPTPIPEYSTYFGVELRWGSTAAEDFQNRVRNRNFRGGISPNEIESALMGVVEVHIGEIISFPFGVRLAAIIEEEHWTNPEVDPSSHVSQLALSGWFLGGKIPPEHVKVSYINMGTGEVPPGICQIDYTSPLPDGTPSLNDWSKKFEEDHLGIVLNVLDNSGKQEIHTEPIYSNPLLGPLSWGLNVWYDIKFDKFGLKAFEQLPSDKLDEALGYLAEKVNNLKSITIYPVKFDADGNARKRTLLNTDEFSV